MIVANSPLPWTVERNQIRAGRERIAEFTGRPSVALPNVAFAVHAANYHQKLVDSLAAFLRAPSVGSSGPGSITIEVQSFNREAAVALLAELGEVA